MTREKTLPYSCTLYAQQRLNRAMTKGAKLLVVAEEQLDQDLAEYALNMAVRLDLEIVILFVRQPGSAGKGRLRPTQEEFTVQAKAGASAFAAQAWQSSVRVTAIVDSGCQTLQ